MFHHNKDYKCGGVAKRLSWYPVDAACFHVFTREEGEKGIWEGAKSVEKGDRQRDGMDLKEQVMHNDMFPRVCQGKEDDSAGVRQQGKE